GPGHLLCFEDRVVGALGSRRVDNLCTERAQKLLALRRHDVGEDTEQAISLGAGDHREANPSVAARRLKDGRVGRQLAALLGRADHVESDAVFHAACRVLTFELGVYLDAGLRRKAGEADKRRIADGVEDRGEGHPRTTSSASSLPDIRSAWPCLACCAYCPLAVA